jgi:hypothetical protein
MVLSADSSPVYNTPFSQLFIHHLDMTQGNSGGCTFYGAKWCFGINNRESVGSPYTNFAQKWNSDTYNFFDTYGNWP